MKAPDCHCGGKCWVHYRDEALDGPIDECSGKLMVSEDYPGEYTHFCEHHGHPDDFDYKEMKTKQ